MKFNSDFYKSIIRWVLTPVAMWYKVRVCGFSLAGIADSNLAGGMDVHLCKCCVLSGRGLCDRAITHAEEPY
jgi:hypothetical protein